jgi:hypothetical protein
MELRNLFRLLVNSESLILFEEDLTISTLFKRR